MPISPRQLETRVISALRLSGAAVSILSPLGTKPIVAALSVRQRPLTLKMYAWNITHGGATRDRDEFRIQLTGSRPAREPGVQTLILGWSEEFEVFAAWDPVAHAARDAASPSLQIHRETLLSAYDSGIAGETRGSGDLVIAFREHLLVPYASTADDLHRERTSLVLEDIHDLVGAVRPPTSAMRTRASREIAYWVRASDFASRVISAYDGRCAICGVQLGLVDAAHIVPVATPGSTDETSNGLCLCSNHHRAYDSGLLLIDEDAVIHVSLQTAEALLRSGRGEGLERMQALDGQRIAVVPFSRDDRPDPSYLRLGMEIRER